MIDTLMVLWTSGSWKHLLRNAGTYLLLFACICMLLFLVTTGSDKWSGLAVTVTQSSESAQPGEATRPHSSNAPATPATSVYSTTVPYIAPIILQNPLASDVSTRTRSEHKHIIRHHTPAHTTHIQPTPPPATPPPDTSSQDPSNPLQNIP